MSGRTTQLGRQLRKLRHSPADGPATTLRRAIQLASELASEHADVEEAAFGALAERGVLDATLAARLADYAENVTVTSEGAEPMAVGADLDRFLRSIETGAPAAELPFAASSASERARPDSAVAVTISGRVVQLEVTHGVASFAVDDRPVWIALPSGEHANSFPLAAAPTTKAEVQRERSGATRLTWSHESLVIEVAADFGHVRVETR